MGNILRKFATDLDPTITARIGTNAVVPQKTGDKPVVELTPTVTPKVRAIIDEMSAAALKEINAL
jgi:hypothetical protein